MSNRRLIALGLLAAVAITALCGCTQSGAGTRYSRETDSLLSVLDRTIELRPAYLARRDRAIAEGFERLSRAETGDERYATTTHLYKLLLKYDHARLKSLLKTAASESGSELQRLQSKIRLAYIYLLETPGEDIDRMLSEIDPEQLPDSLQYEYYSTLYHNSRTSTSIYGGDFAEAHLPDAAQALDKLLDIIDRLDPQPAFSELYLSYDAVGQEAVDALERYLARPDITPSTPEYAMATYRLSRAYSQVGDDEKALAFCIRSAISDIRNSLKDHTSLYELARRLYDDGDLKRAYSYISISVADAGSILSQRMLSNATDIFVIVHGALEDVSQRNLATMRALIAISATLAVAALLFAFFIRRHARRLAAALSQLETMNGKYRTTVDKLTRVSEMKEKYLVQFLTLGAAYIENREAMQSKILKQVRNGNIDNIARLVGANDFIETDIKTFYTLFDAAVLQIFPDFTSRVNGLLKSDRQLKTKSATELTLELRILAMIMLGIDDSADMAKYLRSSINTIYTYRSRIRSRAVEPDKFEQAIAEIGKIYI